MKIQNLEWLVALLGISKLACADIVFYCDGLAITEDHIKTAYGNSQSAPINGYPTVMTIPYYNEPCDYTAYPILLNRETSITSPRGHYFLVWKSAVNWDVVFVKATGTESCWMAVPFLGRRLDSIVTM
ncbi:BgTH12-05215 [Blumeria graminis f. sp. triticale]|uniref:Bgt-51357 n=2 Tax=Blumeria graminis TaxID=34373 RepID=A0A9X9MHD7_BLUGR|nr:BgTH12-05215 [Blumeria graminis f. sp. triticale]VDB88044.1 Bgt-51357 [Blumeria graminis f. sp. tritici]